MDEGSGVSPAQKISKAAFDRFVSRPAPEPSEALRASCAPPMTGLWGRLTDEQKKLAMSYEGDDTIGVWPDPHENTSRFKVGRIGLTKVGRARK